MKRLLLALILVGAAAPAFADVPDTHEELTDRPSGFWTSNRPAVGGAYRYRMLAVGLGVCSITGFFLVRAIKRANAARADRG